MVPRGGLGLQGVFEVPGVFWGGGSGVFCRFQGRFLGMLLGSRGSLGGFWGSWAVLGVLGRFWGSWAGFGVPGQFLGF